jgi:hypothetical protein
MNCVSIWFLHVRSEIGESTFRSLADLVPRYACRSQNIKRDLEVIRDVGADGVGFRVVCARGQLVRDGELIGFARTLVVPWRCRNEVGYIDRLPNSFFGFRVVDLACELNRRIPNPTNIIYIYLWLNPGDCGIERTRWRSGLLGT